ncbi:palmitoyl-protein thioesterase [Histoplasma capsulatum H143]|uniref:Palmitoyl-protein thioesterase 1 n=1 Tax=Ajellomyces capsulatus (strain H143) TaxID=544712 RepID=C6HN38_AJECH|nr:palmitoyl-protein thioesterase [Histoplasma capsulatum H143]
MRFPVSLALILSQLAIHASAVSKPQPEQNILRKRPIPLVIWHGLGDDYGSSGIQNISNLAQLVHPGTYVYVISLGSSRATDLRASYFGNLNEQLEEVCKKLGTEQILSTAPSINALGFSQGGQFLRAYVERCNFPPVHNLVTFGSQHNGISSFQGCSTTGDWLCRAGESLLRWGTWSRFVQSRFVPAQYYRDPADMEQYRAYSNFLADINNERASKNVTYKENMAKLNKFAMYMFENDKMMVPKESSQFAEVNTTDGTVTPLKERRIFKEDWLGLRELDTKGKLDLKTTPGGHMELTDETLRTVFQEYFAPIELGGDVHAMRTDADTQKVLSG